MCFVTARSSSIPRLDHDARQRPSILPGQDSHLNVNSDSSVDFSGRTSGPQQGLVVFQARESETLESNPFIINSHSESVFDGVFYIPNGEFELNSHSGAGTSTPLHMALIARTMTINSDADLIVTAEGGAGPWPVAMSSGGAVRLIQ